MRFFDAVVDLAPGGVGEEILGGMRAAGPERLTVAGKCGIPQVIAPGGVNLMSPRKSRYKPEYYQRRKFDLDELRTFLRVSTEEIQEVARAFAEKLNQATAATVFLFPTQGWSAVDTPESEMFDAEQDSFFLETLQQNLSSRVIVRKVDANLEDEPFADAVTLACLDIFPRPAMAQEICQVTG
jgi:uncharacterized protein (UPF0261 family)